MKVGANDRMKWQLPLLLGFLAVVFLYLAYAFYEHERDTAQQKKRYELEAISSLKAAQVLQWRQERMSEAEYFSTGDVFRPMIERIVNGDQVVAQTYRERLMRIMTNNRYHNIMLLDTRGNLAFAVYPTVHGVDDLTKDMALESVKADTVRIRDFFYCENCKRLMYQLMAPVLDLNGKPVAMLILDIYPSDYIFPYIQTWPLQSQTAENYLIRVLGDSVEFLSPLRFAEIRSMAIADLPFAEENSISSVIRSTSGSAEGYDYRGVSVLSYWQSIEGTSWVLMSEVDTREVYSTLRLLSFLTAGLVLVLLIAMSLVLVWYHQRRKKRLFEALYLQTARLHEAQEEFSAIIYSIGDGVITTDKEGRVKRMNPIAEKWTGWTESDAVGMDVEACFPIFNDTDGSVMGNPIRKVLLDGSIQHLANHTVLVNRRGASVPIADSAAPIKDKEGTLLGTVLVFRTQQEERLRRQLLEFRLTIQDFFQTHDFQEALRFGLESVAHFFKAEQLVYESLEGRRCLNEGMAIPPQIDRILSNGIRDGLMVNESISGWMIVPVIKNERAVALVGFCRIESDFTKDDARHAVYLVDLLWDRMHLKQQEEALRVSERKYRQLTDNLTDVVWVTDLSLETIYVSPSIFALTGETPEEHLSTRLEDKLTPESIENVRRIMQEIQRQESFNPEDRQAFFWVEVEHYHKDGSRLWLEMHFSVLRDEQGNPTGFQGLSRNVTERKKSEAVILEQQRQLSSMIGNLPGFVYRCLDDEHWTMSFISESCTSITGYTPDELTQNSSTSFRAIIDPEALPEIEARWTRAREQKIPFECEYRILTKEGTWKWISERGICVFDDSGEILFLEGYIEDISQRKQNELDLLSSERSYRELIEDMNDMVWILDLEGKVMEVNKRVQLVLGYTKEEVLALGVQGVDPQFNLLFMKNQMQHQSPEEVYIVESEHQSKDGHRIPVEIFASRIYYQTDAAILCIARDVRVRKRNEIFQHLLYKIARSSMTVKTLDELLLQLKTELGMLMDTRTFFVAIANDAGTQFKRILFTEDQCSEDVYPIKDSLAGYVLQTATALLLKGSDYLSFIEEHSILTYTDFPACWMGAPILIDEKAHGVLVVKHARNAEAYDASSLRMLEMLAHELSIIMQRAIIIQALVAAKEKAEESDRLKTAFLANISHEIRTPMNGILGFMELLADPETGEGEREQYLKVMQKSGQRLLVTINDIIEVSKIESGQLEIHESALPLCDLMHYLHTFFAKQIRSEAVRLELRECPDETVHIDRYKLEAVLSNLINNAIKFTRKGQIEFGVRIEGNFLFFFVKDTGVGIPEEKIHRIFDRFIQVDLEITRPYEGSGLGLSIVKAYVDAMGGSIFVESMPGKGSLFQFYLPFKPTNTNQNLNNMTTETRKSEGLDPVKILLAEDDEASSMYIQAIFDRYPDVTLLQASDGLEAVRLAQDNPELDLILMDIKMPGMNGLEAIKQIRLFNPKVPIVAQTAYAFSDDKDNAFKAGCNEYLAKPINRSDLLHLMEKLLGDRWK